MTDSARFELLSDAFDTFQEASRRLEQHYAMLAEKIKTLQKELNEKNKLVERTRRLIAMGEMAAKIAHEIRNPLGSISIYASILLRELDGDEEKRKLAEHISKGVRTLDNLLSNMLLFARSPEPVMDTIDIRDVVDDAINLTTGYGRKQIEFKRQYTGTTTIKGDRGLLTQLFLNLFLNSMDAIEGDGVIGVHTRISKNGTECMEIEVSDTGSGIPAGLQDRIFDPFFTTKDGGTGLGLAIVSTIVNAHKGVIDCNSIPGKGTTFIIRLPVRKGDERGE